jgi:hypothetical protein
LTTTPPSPDHAVHCARKVLARYPHSRCLVIVADRGWLWLDNLSDLSHIALPRVQPLDFALVMPGRHYGELVELLEPLHDAVCARGARRSASLVRKVTV